MNPSEKGRQQLLSRVDHTTNPTSIPSARIQFGPLSVTGPADVLVPLAAAGLGALFGDKVAGRKGAVVGAVSLTALSIALLRCSEARRTAPHLLPEPKLKKWARLKQRSDALRR